MGNNPHNSILKFFLETFNKPQNISKYPNTIKHEKIEVINRISFYWRINIQQSFTTCCFIVINVSNMLNTCILKRTAEAR